jgi:hypothetical protein
MVVDFIITMKKARGLILIGRSTAANVYYPDEH